MLTRFGFKTLGVLLLVAIGAAACAPTAAPATQAPAVVSAGTTNTSNTASATPAAGAVVLQVMDNAKLGKLLADGSGMTLYLFTKDTPGVSNCYDTCAATWPPLLQTGQPVVKDGVDATLLGTTTRKDGTIQVTYHGQPLYTYSKDTAPGDATGQGVGGVWYVVAPDGTAVK